jgi:hypothetical protein
MVPQTKSPVAVLGLVVAVGDHSASAAIGGSPSILFIIKQVNYPVKGKGTVHKEAGVIIIMRSALIFLEKLFSQV